MPGSAHRHQSGTKRAISGTDFGRFEVSLPSLDALRPLNSEQGSPGEQQIGERADDEQAIGVIRDAAVAHPVEAEDPLDHTDGVFDAGTAPGASAVDAPFVFGEVLIVAAGPLGETARVRCSMGIRRSSALRVHSPSSTAQAWAP